METVVETRKCSKCGCELSVDHFKKTRWGGYANVCNDCIKKKKENAIKERIDLARNAKLHAFTPRQLIEELASRGYRGKLYFTETHELDLVNFVPPVEETTK